MNHFPHKKERLGNAGFATVTKQLECPVERLFITLVEIMYAINCLNPFVP